MTQGQSLVSITIQVISSVPASTDRATKPQKQRISYFKPTLFSSRWRPKFSSVLYIHSLKQKKKKVFSLRVVISKCSKKPSSKQHIHYTFLMFTKQPTKETNLKPGSVSQACTDCLTSPIDNLKFSNTQSIVAKVLCELERITKCPL